MTVVAQETIIKYGHLKTNFILIYLLWIVELFVFGERDAETGEDQ